MALEFTDTVAAILAGHTVRAAYLVHLDFDGNPMRFWHGGFGRVVSGGQTWRGTGALSSISGLDVGGGTAASQVKFAMSGVDAELLPIALAASNDIKGRDVTVYLQVFGADWLPLDDPMAVYVGEMDTTKIKASVQNQSIEVTSETVWVLRSRSIFGWLTTKDQESLYPEIDDLGLEFVPALINKSVIWPLSPSS